MTEFTRSKDAGPPKKTLFDVVLLTVGDYVDVVAQTIREITGFSLERAKEMAASVPVTIKESVSAADAEEMKKKLEEAGATAELV